MSAHAHKPAAHLVCIEATAPIARPRTPQSSGRHWGHFIRVTSSRITLSCDGNCAGTHHKFVGSRILSVYTVTRKSSLRACLPCVCLGASRSLRRQYLPNIPEPSSARAPRCGVSLKIGQFLHSDVITVPGTGTPMAGIDPTASAHEQPAPDVRRGRAAATNRTHSHLTIASTSVLSHQPSLQVLPTQRPSSHHASPTTSLGAFISRRLALSQNHTIRIRPSACPGAAGGPSIAFITIRRNYHEEEEFRSHRSCDLYLGCDRSDIRERTALPGSAGLPERSVHSAGADHLFNNTRKR